MGQLHLAHLQRPHELQARLSFLYMMEQIELNLALGIIIQQQMKYLKRYTL